jgi:hypothetical protein
MADYQFIHHYGCEPYADNDGAGGAKITAQNLVITSWGQTNAEEGPDATFFNETVLLIPNPDNTDVGISAFERSVQSQGFHSRHSAHTYVQQNASGQSPIITPVGYVLNPPPEFKQAMAGALVYDGGDPLLFASFTGKKSLMSQYDWRYAVESVAPRAAPTNFDIDTTPAGILVTRAAYSTYLELPSLGSGPFQLPFLKTSGADGSVPQFFDRTTAAGVKEMIAAVNRGEFFVFMQLSGVVLGGQDPAPSLATQHTIVWPHSAARG